MVTQMLCFFVRLHFCEVMWNLKLFDIVKHEDGFDNRKSCEGTSETRFNTEPIAPSAKSEVVANKINLGKGTPEGYFIHFMNGKVCDCKEHGFNDAMLYQQCYINFEEVTPEKGGLTSRDLLRINKRKFQVKMWNLKLFDTVKPEVWRWNVNVKLLGRGRMAGWLFQFLVNVHLVEHGV